MNKIKVLPNKYLKNKNNYSYLQAALTRVNSSSRELPDVMTMAMLKLCEKQNITDCVHIPYWHQITDEDSRTLRNMLKMNAAGDAPKSQCRDHDLLQYLSMCLQFLDVQYEEYVKKWCLRQEQCLDEEKDDF